MGWNLPDGVTQAMIDEYFEPPFDEPECECPPGHDKGWHAPECPLSEEDL